jgi:branched-chain amino acid transport system substrate-binding protein
MKVLVRVASVMVLIVFLVLSYGCSKANSPSTTNSALEPYKIGAVFAKTGANSSIGTPEAQTMEMVVAEINAAGGINGHSLQAIIYDTQSDTTQALTLVKKLIEQDNVAAIVGPSSTGESLAVLDTVTKSGVPLISCASSSQITTPIAERKWVFKSAGEDVLAVQKLTDYLTQLKITKVALICDSNGYGQTGRTVLMSALPKVGATIVADEKYDSNDTDMSIQLTKIKGTDAQAVVCWGTNPAPPSSPRT